MMDKLKRLHGIRRDQEIDGYRVKMYFLSRDPALLAGLAIVILSIAAGFGWALRQPVVKKAASSLLERHMQQVTGEEEDEFDALQQRGEKASQSPAAPHQLIRALANNPSEEAKQVSEAFVKSVTSFDKLPTGDLLFYAHWVKPYPLANELVGDLNLRRGKIEIAKKYYQRELKVSGNESTRRKLIALFAYQEDFESLGGLAADPKNAALIPESLDLELKAYQRRWLQIPGILAKYELKMWQPIPAAMALIAGLVWLVIALQTIQPRKVISFRTVIPVIAVGAGALSTLVTLFAVLWQEREFGLRLTGDFLGDLLYYVAGVGPREEVIKLLFFVPFLPVLLVRDSRLEALFVAACVGLGFAMEENLQYFAQAGPALAFGRFLTANFFHMAATGAIGVALYDAIKSPRQNALRFLGVSLGVIVAHGFYDAFMGVAELQLLQTGSMIVFVLLSLYFFQQVRTSRDGFTDQFSIAATLIIGLSVLTGAIFVCASIQLGFEGAAAVIAYNAVGLVMIAYMFYWQLGAAMSEPHQAGPAQYDYEYPL